jgi:hypothetical protein
MSAGAGGPAQELNAAGSHPDRRLHLVSSSLVTPATADRPPPNSPATPAEDHCYRCDEQAVEHIHLVIANRHQPPRPPVALCGTHLARHASGAEAIGWCNRGAHHGRRDSYCDIHLGTIN